MLHTASVKLNPTQEEATLLETLSQEYIKAYNLIDPQMRCWNRVALHNIVYSQLRSTTKLGSQMTCSAIYFVCKAYQAQKELGKIRPGKIRLRKIRKDSPIPEITFNKGTIHFDLRTYTFTKTGKLSLYTLEGRIKAASKFPSH